VDRDGLVLDGVPAGSCIRYRIDLAAAVASRVAGGCEIIPCSSDEHPRPAARPAYSVLDLSKTEAAVGPLRSWRDNLLEVLERLE